MNYDRVVIVGDKVYGFYDYDDAISFMKDMEGSRMTIIRTAKRNENGDWFYNVPV